MVEKKKKSLYISYTWTERKRNGPRKLKDFGNARYSAPERETTRLPSASLVSRYSRLYPVVLFFSTAIFSSSFTRDIIFTRADRSRTIEIPKQVYTEW